ncbi:hypothetical protein OHA91_06110 [Streptomyces erythrochromogenes]|uniref:Uncharacterized protein n=1 Tax=Streptomyces erythrochromogenes TaxID=285574 RepID=A0ABZ1Q6N1_9ACTN|nr:hypothetical protein [Streptomyces erythrochromogenes]
MFQNLEPLDAACPSSEITVVNPALIPCLTGELDGVLTVRLEKARISGCCCDRNPEELTRAETEAPLARR